jgi:hypothetical protein
MCKVQVVSRLKGLAASSTIALMTALLATGGLTASGAVLSAAHAETFIIQNGKVTPLEEFEAAKAKAKQAGPATSDRLDAEQAPAAPAAAAAAPEPAASPPAAAETAAVPAAPAAPMVETAAKPVPAESAAPRIEQAAAPVPAAPQQPSGSPRDIHSGVHKLAEQTPDLAVVVCIAGCRNGGEEVVGRTRQRSALAAPPAGFQRVAMTSETAAGTECVAGCYGDERKAAPQRAAEAKAGRALDANPASAPVGATDRSVVGRVGRGETTSAAGTVPAGKAVKAVAKKRNPSADWFTRRFDVKPAGQQTN